MAQLERASPQGQLLDNFTIDVGSGVFLSFFALHPQQEMRITRSNNIK